MLLAENAGLRARLEEAEETLRAIQGGEVDALIVNSSGGPHVFTLQGLDAESNRFRGEILAQVSDAVIAVDNEQRLTYLNAAAERQYGVTASEALGRCFAEICGYRWIRPEDAVDFLTALRTTGHWHGENIHIKRNGEVLFVETSVSCLRLEDGTQTGLLSVIRDITERKRVEADLAAAHAAVVNERNRLEAVMQALPVGLSILDAKGGSIRVNPAFETIWGGACPEVNGIADYAAYEAWWTGSGQPVPPEEWASAQAVERGETVVGQELEIQRFDGTRGFISNSAAPIRDADGRITGCAVAIMDVTQRKRAEEALKKAHGELEQRVEERTAELQLAYGSLSESEERFRQMAENVREVFWLSDASLRKVYYASPAFEELWGRTCQELAENPHAWLESVHPEDRERVARTFLSTGELGVSVCCEYRILHPDGSIRWIADQASPVRDSAGQVYRITGVARDITLRKKAEGELKRAHRALLILKKCDKALARAYSERELLERICQIILGIDGMKMAWVGFAEHDQKKTVRVVAYAGDSDGYLNNAKITWADEPRGRGPTGSAIRKRKVNVCRDTRRDKRLAPWRAQQLKRGYASSIALPLVWESHCLGALTIYSVDADAFNQEEVDLLTRLAGDLSYGIIALRTRAEREELQQELLKISEREKQLIAQELHDGLCQHFAGTAMMASLLQRRLAAKQDPEAEQARQICDLLNTGVHEARNLSHGLHPVKAEGEGLMEALSGLAQTVTKLFHVRCTFVCDDTVLVEDQTAATHMFRMAQEAVNNAMKHGQATKVRITLEEVDGAVTLSIRDNGIGIPRDLPVSKGMGMQIMNHRAAAIGAMLSVRRAGSRGTVVACTLSAPAGSMSPIQLNVRKSRIRSSE